MARRFIVYVATSADGFIARPDGGVDWLNYPRTAGDYGMAAFHTSIDTVLWGRKTYDMALRFMKKGANGAESDPRLKNYVFSHTQQASTPGAEFVSEPVGAFARRLRAIEGKDIWLMGGGGLIASFLDAGEVDDFIIHAIPTFIGEGIPLIAPKHRNVPLTLQSSTPFKDSVVRLHYSVDPSTAAARSSASARRAT